MAAEFCPSCGTARVGSFRFCRSCAFDFDTLTAPAAAQPAVGPPPAVALPVVAPTAPRPVGSDAVGWLTWIVAVIIAAGFVWAWLNTGNGDLVIHLFAAGFVGAIWTGFVLVVVAILGFFGILGAALAYPFRRRR